ncbi:MAG: RNase adapter RapZ [Gammaproteobacteria bacterium]|nr:RNase adapter RapZ [Gammaproteobacteria bacterium]
MQLILISGLSGSGKSIALNVLEDSGFYCVDNLPAQLLPNLAGFLDQAGYERIAVSVDVRSGGPLHRLPDFIAQLKAQGFDLRLLFLEAKGDTLVKRFSETRRRHPLSSGERTLQECIQLEHELLEPLSGMGHRIDTSDLNPNALRAWIKDFVNFDRSRLTLVFQSFGFKHGIPLDADCVFDVRCLPNPHYDPNLRPLTGKDAAVAAFLDGDSSVQKMLADIRRFVEDWLPCFLRDNRNYLTIALGCTGGQHRSVYFAEKLAEDFRTAGQPVMVRHRELS